MDKNTSKAIALCDEGMQHCSEPKATVLFQQLKEILKGEPSTAKKSARKGK